MSACPLDRKSTRTEILSDSLASVYPAAIVRVDRRKGGKKKGRKGGRERGRKEREKAMFL